MAKRNLLHRDKFDSFVKWLEDNNFKITPTKGQYEVLRWENNNDTGYKGVMPIIYSGKSNQHFSCNDSAARYVRKFIDETK